MGSFSIHNMILSVGYAATVMLILAPRWFDLPVRLTLGILIVVIVLNGMSGLIEISVMRSVIGRLPANLAGVVPRLAGSLMLALAALFVVSSAKNLYSRRDDPIWLFFCVAMLLLVVSPGKIVHQYSSRYTAMASETMILVSDPFVVTTPWRIIRIAIGMFIGLLSLLTYYYNTV